MLNKLIVLAFITTVMVIAFGCTEKKPTELDTVMKKTTTGKITAFGPNYLTLETSNGIPMNLSSISNLGAWKTMMVKFIEKKANVVISYEEKYDSSGQIRETVVESMMQE